MVDCIQQFMKIGDYWSVAHSTPLETPISSASVWREDRAFFLALRSQSQFQLLSSALNGLSLNGTGMCSHSL